MWIGFDSLLDRGVLTTNRREFSYASRRTLSNVHRNMDAGRHLQRTWRSDPGRFANNGMFEEVLESGARVDILKIILAIYYLLVDVVLVSQCFYYKGFTMTDKVQPKSKPLNGNHDAETAAPTERTALLDENNQGRRPGAANLKRSESQRSLTQRLFPVDATHLSPANPLHSDPKRGEPETVATSGSTVQQLVINALLVVMVIMAGILGWWLQNRNKKPTRDDRIQDPPEFNILGQIFGYICSVLYLGSRIPQLLLNHRRRTTEGISMMFFLFACIGNLTYNFSIFAYSPQAACEVPMKCLDGEAKQVYGKYIAINLPWILGSLGTLCLDMGVFVQYFMYKRDDEVSDYDEEPSPVEDAVETPVGRRREGRGRNVAFVEEGNVDES